MAICQEKLISMYTTMIRIRTFEEKIAEFFREGKTPGAIHLYLGQEAIAAGICASLEKEDYIVSNHRGHGHLLARGADPKKMMAEILGKRTGYCKGKGGSLHIAIPEIGFLGTIGIVGAGAPIAVGAAFASQYQETGGVTISFFGDGALNQGTINEALNLAACWKLPIIFVNENNLYGLSTHVNRIMAIRNITERAAGFGIPGTVEDGNDVIAIFEASSAAVNRARKGEGPSLIECKTYRWRGHFEGDPAVYRSKEEVQEWKAKDCIPRFERRLLDFKIMGEEEMKEIKKKVGREISEAAKFAEDSPYADLEELYKDIYSQ